MSNSKLTRRSLLGSAAGFVLAGAAGPALAKGNPIYVTAEQIQIKGGTAIIANRDLAVRLKEGDGAAAKLMQEAAGEFTAREITIDGAGRVLVNNENFALKLGKKAEGEGEGRKLNIICGGGC